MIEMDLYYWFKNDFIEEYGSDSINYVDNLPSPRFLKTHLTGHFLPKQFDQVNPKVIYIARNPKDIYCSYYTHLKMFHALKAPFEDYAKYYIAGKAPMGCPIAHQLSFWNKRFDPNVLFLWYEDIKADTKTTIKKIANFLEKPITEENLERLHDYVSLEKMKSNPGVNLEKLIEQCYGDDVSDRFFIGKGQIGSWKTKMSEKMSEEFDDWIEKKTKNTDLRY
ncbi:luciferin sulfotransferase-like [Onthophagus taurus]|uniref:luciferin sulfotransferase-like n=1 Tax=Onthophagus taurus TaxID=166361 RepID=UPI0039BEA927